ncbi:hypothetical protein GCM10008965_16730 [Methylorubrum aminovorans]
MAESLFAEVIEPALSARMVSAPPASMDLPEAESIVASARVFTMLPVSTKPSATALASFRALPDALDLLLTTALMPAFAVASTRTAPVPVVVTSVFRICALAPAGAASFWKASPISG